MRRSSLTLASVPACFVGGDGLDLALAEEAARALISSAARMWPFSEGSPSTAAAPVRKVMCPVLYGVSRNVAFGRFGGGLDQLRSGYKTSPCETGPTDRHAERAEEISAIDLSRFVHGVPPGALASVRLRIPRCIPGRNPITELHGARPFRQLRDGATGLASAIGTPGQTAWFLSAHSRLNDELYQRICQFSPHTLPTDCAFARLYCGRGKNCARMIP